MGVNIETAVQTVCDDIAAIANIVNAPVIIPPVGEPPLTQIEIDAGLTRTTFFDGFDDPATVDLARTYDANRFKWFFDTWRPDSDALGPMAPTVSVSDSKLHLTRDYLEDAFGSILTTMFKKTDQPRAGFASSGDMIVRIAVQCDPHGAETFPRSWPCGWILAGEQLDLPTPGTCIGSHVEVDIFEWMPRGLVAPYVATPVFSARQWACHGTYPSCYWNDQQFDHSTIGTSLPAGWDLSEMNEVMMHYRAAITDGNGFLKWYVTQPGGLPTHLPECDITWATGDGSAMHGLDNQTCRLILGCGRGFAADFDFVCMRQR